MFYGKQEAADISTNSNKHLNLALTLDNRLSQKSLKKISKMQIFCYLHTNTGTCIYLHKMTVYFNRNNNNKLSKLTPDNCELPQPSLAAIA